VTHEEFRHLVEGTLYHLKKWNLEQGAVTYDARGVCTIHIVDKESQDELLLHEVILEPCKEKYLEFPMVTLWYDGCLGIPLPAMPDVLCAVIQHGWSLQASLTPN
jgi:hypothetical protein